MLAALKNLAGINNTSLPSFSPTCSSLYFE